MLIRDYVKLVRTTCEKIKKRMWRSVREVKILINNARPVAVYIKFINEVDYNKYRVCQVHVFCNDSFDDITDPFRTGLYFIVYDVWSCLYALHDAKTE
jgi:hypothetical protein